MCRAADVRTLAGRANPVSANEDVTFDGDLLGVGGKVTPGRILCAATVRTVLGSWRGASWCRRTDSPTASRRCRPSGSDDNRALASAEGRERVSLLPRIVSET